MASLSLTQPSAHGAMRVWLLCVAALVVGMVVVGGATRLTGSGLSITEWAPIMGSLPPLSHDAWERAFEMYKQIPQYQINRHMALEDFKQIFWWEWGHRFLGRFIGVAYALPLLWFFVRGQVAGKLRWKLLVLLVLGGMQGAVGWWMVKSGLVDRVDVAPYRLAVHLTLASVILAGLLHVALEFCGQAKPEPAPVSLRRGAQVYLLLVFVQIFLGALVAGNGAGRIYTTWPLMEGGLWPSGMGFMTPFWHNFFENTATVQFMHRLGAYVLLGLALWQWLRARSLAPQMSAIAGVNLLAVLAQAGLGIATLLAVVPLGLALLHQFGMTIVLALAVMQQYRAVKPD